MILINKDLKFKILSDVKNCTVWYHDGRVRFNNDHVWETIIIKYLKNVYGLTHNQCHQITVEYFKWFGTDPIH